MLERLPRFHHFLLSALLLTGIGGSLPPLHASEPKKEIYAHYMGCFPLGYGAIEHSRKNEWKNLSHESPDYIQALGGRFVNWPLMPQDVTLTPEQSAELEIRRAIRAGMDGFAVDAWAGGDNAKATLDHLFAAAEKLKLPFKLTICLDPACHEKREEGNHIQTYTESISWLLGKYGNSPYLARRDGKPLILGYSSSGIIFDPAFRRQPEGPEKWKQISAAYEQVEKNVGQPLFFHFCFDNMAGALPPELRPQAAEWAAENFGAVGGFLGNNWHDDQETIAAIRKHSEWSQPLYFQYNNKAGSLFVEPGTDKLRKSWKEARDNDSSLIQFVTWNDYGEDTVLAPGYSTNYTITSLNRHLVDWWKQGSEPQVDKDQLHLIYRRAVNEAQTFPFHTRRRTPGVLEVATILTAPGTVSVPEYNISYEAPAGLSVRQFPLQVGEVAATLSREGREVLSVRAPEPVTDKPFREDNTMVCFSSNFLEEWREDFGETPPLLYAENADADGDGLPNWFEMYYFGKFPDMQTATAAKPDENPDGDALSNREEYLRQTDPKKAEAPYTVGHVWDFSSIEERVVSFNPDRDSLGRDVWHYLYKHGDAKAIPRDGNYPRMPSGWANVSYAGRMAHLSPSTEPEGLPYRYLHGWIAREQTAEGRWKMNVRPRANAAVILGWQSPVAGSVKVSYDVTKVSGMDPISFEVLRNDELTPLLSQVVNVGDSTHMEIDDVTVQPGDFLYLFVDGKPRYDSSSAELENFKITLKTVNE